MRRCQKILLSIVVANLYFLNLSTYADNSSGLKQDLFSVSFPVPKSGWACGRWGTIVRTQDGGNSWSRQNSNTDYTLTSICFIDEKKGWAVGAGGTIVHTQDGGKTWAFQKSPVAYYMMSVFFTDATNGWIATEKTTVLNTRDGGNTWDIQFSDEDYILKSISFCDSKTGWVVGEYGYIYNTIDGGESWQKQAGNFLVNEYGDFSGDPILFTVRAIDPSTAWAAGIEGNVTKTSDGGKTWKKISIAAPRKHLFGIVLDREERIFICGDGILLGSTDGGKTFKTVRTKPSIKYGWLHGISIAGDNGFLAVGRDGSIYRTANENFKWDKVAW